MNWDAGKGEMGGSGKVKREKRCEIKKEKVREEFRKTLIRSMKKEYIDGKLTFAVRAC